MTAAAQLQYPSYQHVDWGMTPPLPEKLQSRLSGYVPPPDSLAPPPPSDSLQDRAMEKARQKVSDELLKSFRVFVPSAEGQGEPFDPWWSAFKSTLETCGIPEKHWAMYLKTKLSAKVAAYADQEIFIDNPKAFWDKVVNVLSASQYNVKLSGEDALQYMNTLHRGFIC